jgi:cytoskeletal protein CcmA (bactofilin family)
MENRINFGRSIQLKGDLTGSEDLTIDGKLDGKIFLKENKLTIGENGQIKADIQAKEVLVAGHLTGNITATDRVEVATTGTMQGDISAPRVVLADGAQFRGSVDMDPHAPVRSEDKSSASSSS